MTTTTLRLPPRIARLPQLRQIVRGGLAARGSIGAGLAAKAGGAAAAPWYLVGGAPAPMAVWQPIRAASLAASYLRIAGSAGYANIDPAVVGGVAPAFDTATGWGFNGSKRLLTGYTMPAQGTILIAFNDSITTNATTMYLAGSTLQDDFFLTNSYVNWANACRYQKGNAINKTPAITSGVLGMASFQPYRNGSPDGSALSESGAAFGPITLGGYDNVSNWIGNITAVAIWDTSTNHATWMPAVMAAAAAL